MLILCSPNHHETEHIPCSSQRLPILTPVKKRFNRMAITAEPQLGRCEVDVNVVNIPKTTINSFGGADRD